MILCSFEVRDKDDSFCSVMFFSYHKTSLLLLCLSQVLLVY